MSIIKDHPLTLLFILSAFTSNLNLHAADQGETHQQLKPAIAERSGIAASLKAMRDNGALEQAQRQRTQRQSTDNNSMIARRSSTQSTTDDAESAIAIKHVLTCETEPNCQAAVDWAGNNHFNTTGVLTSEGHGGETLYHLFLRQEVQPDEDAIASETSRVHEGIQGLDGIQYATWMVDFDPDGENDHGGQL